MSNNGCLIPSILCDSVCINLGSYKGIINTFREIEQSHWDYLDNYRDNDRHRYPTLSMHHFTYELLAYRGYSIDIDTISYYIRQYNKYRKNIPTAGVIYCYGKNFVIIKMRYSNIWSMPKGKKEKDEDILYTAKREFYEETGIDLQDTILNETPFIVVNKTIFYIIEANNMNPYFMGYNIKEVDKVRWINTQTVLNDANLYSKQVVSIAKYLDAK